MKSAFIAILGIAFLAGCAQNGFHDYEEPSELQGRQQHPEPIVVRVSGFGSYEDAVGDRLDARKRLLARRASQLDAYRNLAERVYGTAIHGSSTVSDFVSRDDIFRTYVDSYIRGARLVTVNEHSDGVVETVMELKLERRFRECVSRVSDRDVARLCPVPMPRGNDAAEDVVSGRGTDSLYYLD